jgi:hypothetical protein
VHKFETGEVAKLAHMIEQTRGDLLITWIEGHGWLAQIDILGKGTVYIQRVEDIRRLAEFMRWRAPGNKPSYVDLFRTLETLADKVAERQESGELPPNLLAIMHPQGSA